MNEKIKKLIKQATTIRYSGPGEIEEFDREKFAELIVEECLKKIYYSTLMSHPEHNWSEKEIGFNEGIDVAYKKVKQHFGVEE